MLVPLMISQRHMTTAQLTSWRQMEKHLLCMPHAFSIFPSCICSFRFTRMQSTSMRVDVCVHFGCLTLVGESTRMPLRYHQNNVAGTLNLMEVLEKHGVREIVFSSSAAVYGDAPQPRGPDGRWGGLTESSRVGQGIATAYARSMLMVEQVLEDLHKSPAGKSWGIMILRYFSPVAAHPSGRIGEDPTRPPNNLLPYVAQVAVGRRDFLTVFGDDYETHDGTLARDYIHVM